MSLNPTTMAAVKSNGGASPANKSTTAGGTPASIKSDSVAAGKNAGKPQKNGKMSRFLRKLRPSCLGGCVGVGGGKKGVKSMKAERMKTNDAKPVISARGSRTLGEHQDGFSVPFSPKNGFVAHNGRFPLCSKEVAN